MSTVRAMHISSFSGFANTNDGNHVLLFATANGANTPIAISREQIFRLMAMLSSAASRALSAETLHPARNHVFSVEGFEWRNAADHEGLVVTIVIPGGMRLSFLFDLEKMKDLLKQFDSITRFRNSEKKESAIDHDSFIWSNEILNPLS